MKNPKKPDLRCNACRQGKCTDCLDKKLNRDQCTCTRKNHDS